jgi:hypothetical protein
MTLNILARTRHLQLIPPDPKLGSSPRSPSSSLSDSPKDKAKNNARKKNDKANSGPIPSLRKASTELQPQSPRPLLQKSLSELRGTAPTLPAQITLNKVRRPAPLSLSNIQSVQLSAAAATRNRIVTDPLPGPLTDYLVSALPTVPNSPPLMSPAMRALVDPILLPIQSPAKLSQPRFSLDARERPEDFAEHPVFQTEGDIDIRGHHHNKVSTLLGEISKLNIVTQASQAPVKNEEYDPLEKYSEKNRQKRINHGKHPAWY